MDTLRALLKIALLCLACLSSIEQAHAQTCTVSATAMAFGIYDPKSNLPTDSSANVVVVCQATIALLVAYTVKLSAGGSNNLLARKMTTTGSQLSYQVYKDPTYSQVWGDGSSSTSYNIGGYLLSVLVPVSTTYIAYGRITALQNVFAGTYTDTLTILVTY